MNASPSSGTIDAAALAALVRPGARIAVADGCGTPRAAFEALSALARERGDLRLLLGWMPAVPEGLDLAAFADARTVMPGWGLRAGVAEGHVRAIPVRLSATPALVTGALRPDLLLVGAAPDPRGLVLGSEVSWVRAVIESGVPIAAVVDDALPRAAAGAALPDDRTHAIGHTRLGPNEVPGSAAPSAEHRAIGRHVVGLLPDGARLQWAPGQLGQAVVAAVLERGRPVHVDSGLLGDGVVDLDEAGLLASDAVATYLVGTRRLYEWADARGRGRAPRRARRRAHPRPGAPGRRPAAGGGEHRGRDRRRRAGQRRGHRPGDRRGHRRAPGLRRRGHPLTPRPVGRRARQHPPRGARPSSNGSPGR